MSGPGRPILAPSWLGKSPTRLRLDDCVPRTNLASQNPTQIPVSLPMPTGSPARALTSPMQRVLEQAAYCKSPQYLSAAKRTSLATPKRAQAKRARPPLTPSSNRPPSSGRTHPPSPAQTPKSGGREGRTHFAAADRWPDEAAAVRSREAQLRRRYIAAASRVSPDRSTLLQAELHRRYIAAASGVGVGQNTLSPAAGAASDASTNSSPAIGAIGETAKAMPSDDYVRIPHLLPEVPRFTRTRRPVERRKARTQEMLDEAGSPTPTSTMAPRTRQVVGARRAESRAAQVNFALRLSAATAIETAARRLPLRREYLKPGHGSLAREMVPPSAAPPSAAPVSAPASASTGGAPVGAAL